MVCTDSPCATLDVTVDRKIFSTAVLDAEEAIGSIIRPWLGVYHLGTAWPTNNMMSNCHDHPPYYCSLRWDPWQCQALTLKTSSEGYGLSA
ncbi:hypothetical protein BS47DRAFT_1347229 [Hydnum rufescens UP504]|uniref:Uncharacterized protein n=1 Tax=Hydnum rufescens UP504 TaxID=1448309 RepID=A0A9P6AS70_9AGAM|nr:hypothetical protein BS47DRAFT_1347229 [Hydnum rufescens UP504]